MLRQSATAILSLTLAVAAGTMAVSQDPSVITTPAQNGRNQITGRPGADLTPAFSPAAMEKLARTRQTDRQKKIVTETDRLLALAGQLKSDLGKPAGQPAQSSADELKKAEEIEKLAHSVKEHMRG